MKSSHCSNAMRCPSAERLCAAQTSRRAVRNRLNRKSGGPYKARQRSATRCRLGIPPRSDHSPNRDCDSERRALSKRAQNVPARLEGARKVRGNSHPRRTFNSRRVPFRKDQRLVPDSVGQPRRGHSIPENLEQTLVIIARNDSLRGLGQRRLRRLLTPRPLAGNRQGGVFRRMSVFRGIGEFQPVTATSRRGSSRPKREAPGTERQRHQTPERTEIAAG